MKTLISLLMLLCLLVPCAVNAEPESPEAPSSIEAVMESLDFSIEAIGTGTIPTKPVTYTVTIASDRLPCNPVTVSFIAVWDAPFISQGASFQVPIGFEVLPNAVVRGI